MAKGKGSKRGPGGVIMSAVLIFIAAGAAYGFSQANGIDGPGGFIDWTKSSSKKLEDCLQPDVDFWTCNSGSSSSGGSGSNSGSNGKGSSEGSGSEGSTGTAPSAALKKLEAIPVGNPKKVDYDRGEWNHWVGGRCDDTRQQVLREQAQSFKLDGEGCRVASGVWIDPYTGKKFTDPSKLDIDHVYALGAAAKNGGNDWSKDKKEKFANDKSHLLAVSASANRSKSDRNPKEWWPENSAYSCQFATKYIDIATKYKLQFSDGDVFALKKGLKTCS